MSDMTNQLGAILGNPELMKQIMSMAQTMQNSAASPGPPSAESPAAVSEPPAPAVPTGVPLELMARLSDLSGKTGLDGRQQALLQALHPYLTQGRIQKLEKAMHAAKLADLAAELLNKSGIQSVLGR